jgi:hypothetical protein
MRGNVGAIAPELLVEPLVQKMAENIEIERAKGPFKAKQIESFAAPGMYHDGMGLYLQVTAGKGGKARRSWIFRFQMGSRARQMGLGAFPPATRLGRQS